MGSRTAVEAVATLLGVVFLLGDIKVAAVEGMITFLGASTIAAAVETTTFLVRGTATVGAVLTFLGGETTAMGVMATFLGDGCTTSVDGAITNSVTVERRHGLLHVTKTYTARNCPLTTNKQTDDRNECQAYCWQCKQLHRQK